MSSFRSLAARAFCGLWLCGAAAALAQSAPAESASSPSVQSSAPESAQGTPGDARQGTFKTVQGEVTVVRGNVRIAAVVGGPLNAADRVLTGEKSAAAVTLKDGTVLSIGPSSMVDLSEFSFDATTQDGNVLIALARGSLRVVTGLIAKLKPEQVKVTTPTTVIGVRGTDFIVEENP